MGITATKKQSDLRPIGALKAALAWMTTEILVSIAFLLVVGIWIFVDLRDVSVATRELSNRNFPALVIATFPTMGILYWGFDRYRRRLGLNHRGLGYHSLVTVNGVNWEVIRAGILSSLILMVFINWGTSHLDTYPEDDQVLRLSQAGPLVAGLHYLGNAAIVPIVEEFAWRGVIQTIFRGALGPGAAIATTALLFTGKHVVMEGVGRIATLVVGSLTLSIVRERWGTTASTICHLLLNQVATLWLISDAFLS